VPIDVIVKPQCTQVTGARKMRYVRNAVPAGQVIAVPRQARDDGWGDVVGLWRAVARFSTKGARQRALRGSCDYSGSNWLAGKLAFNEPYFADASIRGCI
jgi:hypothetical protein